VSAGLAKLLDKSFVLGYALPSLIFLTVAVWVFGCPSALCDAKSPAATNPFAQLTYAALLVYILAVLLMAINYGLYRLFEGYLPPASWFRFSKHFHQARLAERQKAIDALGNDPSAGALKWQLRQAYPQKKSDVLPTAFGNAIRAFEVYPYDTYGADSISVWPRLLAVVPKDFQGLINDAKSLVDLFVNLAALFLGLFLFSASVDVLQHFGVRFHLAPPHAGGRWSIVALASLVASAASYRFAVSLVPDWGDQVKSAFDCYLPALAKTLGYTMPRTEAARREVWDGLSGRLLYGEKFDPPYAADNGHETAPPKKKQHDPVAQRNVAERPQSEATELAPDDEDDAKEGNPD
jgi:hypothetical protein